MRVCRLRGFAPLGQWLLSCAPLPLSAHDPAQSGQVHKGFSQMPLSLLLLFLLSTINLLLHSLKQSYPFVFISFFIHSLCQNLS